MKLYKWGALALCVLLAGCGAGHRTGDDTVRETQSILDAPASIPPAPLNSPVPDAAGEGLKDIAAYAGFWHAGDSIGSGYAARYEFFQDGTFIYAANEMDGLDRVRYRYGVWRGIFSDGALHLRIDEQLLWEGGEEMPSEDSMATETMLEGQTLRLHTGGPPVLEERRFQDCGVDPETGYRVISIDGELFYGLLNQDSLLEEYNSAKEEAAP